MKAKNSGGGKAFAIPEAGPTLARCYQVLDMGTQIIEFKGQKKSVPRVQISWELPQLMHVFDDAKGPQPFSIHQEFTVSTYASALLRKMLESWMGRALKPEEEAEFDLAKLVGIAGYVNIVHNKSKDGSKTYANMGSIMPVPKGMKCPPLINPSMMFEIGTPDQFEKFEKLQDFLKKKIELSPEWMQQKAERPKDMAQGTADFHPANGEEEEPGF